MSSEDTKQTETKQNYPYEDFAKFDIRAGRVVSVEAIPKSKKLLKLEVSFGSEIGNRTILAGIAQASMYGTVVDGAWKDSALVGAGVVAVLNLEPREMMGIASHGMILATRIANSLFLISPGFAEGGEKIG